ncbi:toprim domain-containing protein [Vibrio breoganii]
MNNKPYSWQTILSEFYDHFCDSAASVGIDGVKLFGNLPQSGEMMTGHSVPVIETKYRNTCSVLFYINHTQSGGTWPYFKFHTFKHGGVVSEFNGLRLAKGNFITHEPVNATVPKQTSKRSSGVNDEWRLGNFQAHARHYFSARSMDDSQWLHQRLCGQATQSLLLRTPIRHDGKGSIYAPISHTQHGLVGYHKIILGDADKKRHYVLASGMLKGSVIKIDANPSLPSESIAICEGLATGLSIAMVWNGPVLIALTAGNLAPVRESISTNIPVTFFADNDCWKPNVGNTGIRCAKQAIKRYDRIYWPTFDDESKASHPTDFNDLHRLEGLGRLRSQIPRAT